VEDRAIDDDGSDSPAVEHFDVTVAFMHNSTQMKLRGELDLASGPVLVRAFEERGATSRSIVVIDLADIHYCDSSGISALMRIATRCKSDGTELRTTGVNDHIRRVFDITNVGELLNVVSGEDGDGQMQ
jgi:anti-sigma B factor antagonist